MREKYEKELAEYKKSNKELKTGIEERDFLVKKAYEVMDKNTTENDRLQKIVKEQLTCNEPIKFFYFADCYNALSLPNAY